MDELRVPTRRVEVEIVFANGSTDHGSFYLTDSPYADHAAKELAEFLNDEREFVPFSSDDSHVGLSLICKRHFLRVRAQNMDADSLMSPGVEPTDDDPPCVVLFDDETRLTGRAVHEVPVASSRLVDKVNQAPPFLAFLTSSGLEFLQVAHIVRITTGD